MTILTVMHYYSIKFLCKLDRSGEKTSRLFCIVYKTFEKIMLAICFLIYFKLSVLFNKKLRNEHDFDKDYAPQAKREIINLLVKSASHYSVDSAVYSEIADSAYCFHLSGLIRAVCNRQ